MCLTDVADDSSRDGIVPPVVGYVEQGETIEPIEPIKNKRGRPRKVDPCKADVIVGEYLPPKGRHLLRGTVIPAKGSCPSYVIPSFVDRPELYGVDSHLFPPSERGGLPTWKPGKEPRGDVGYSGVAPRRTEDGSLTMMQEEEYRQFDCLFERAMDAVASGQTLSHFLDRDGRGFKSHRYIYWVRKDRNRLKRYENAQLLYAEQLGSELIEISDGVDGLEDVNRSKLRVESRKWLMYVYNKPRYGDVKTVEVSGINIVNILAAADSRLLEHVINNDIEDEET